MADHTHSTHELSHSLYETRGGKREKEKMESFLSIVLTPKTKQCIFYSILWGVFLAFYATFPILLIGTDLGKNKNHTNSWLLGQGESTWDPQLQQTKPSESLDWWHYHGGNTELPVTLSVVKTARVRFPISTENSTYAVSKKGSYKKI